MCAHTINGNMSFSSVLLKFTIGQTAKLLISVHIQVILDGNSLTAELLAELGTGCCKIRVRKYKC